MSRYHDEHVFSLYFWTMQAKRQAENLDSSAQSRFTVFRRIKRHGAAETGKSSVLTTETNFQSGHLKLTTKEAPSPFLSLVRYLNLNLVSGNCTKSNNEYTYFMRPLVVGLDEIKCFVMILILCSS